MVSAACIVRARFNVSVLPTCLCCVLGGRTGQEVQGRRGERGRTESLSAADDEIWLFSDIMYIMQGGVSYGGPSEQCVWLC